MFLKLLLAKISEQKCNGCGKCIQICPHKAIRTRKTSMH
ncbi:MAG TPA: hypothetical protein ENH75_09950 [archaeon]|nr:hypothetical protein [archaeon]